jgi:hypothetical protein
MEKANNEVTMRNFKHGKVVLGILGVMSGLNNIVKDMAYENRRGETEYTFYSLDLLRKSLNPLLVENGLVLLPVSSSIVSIYNERKVGTKETDAGPVSYDFNVEHATVKSTYMIICAEDGSYIELEVMGSSSDAKDKAVIFAQSSAFKQLCSNTFCIGTSDDFSEPLPDDEGEIRKRSGFKKNTFIPPAPAQDIVKDIPQTIGKAEGEALELPEGVKPKGTKVKSKKKVAAPFTLETPLANEVSGVATTDVVTDAVTTDTVTAVTEEEAKAEKTKTTKTQKKPSETDEDLKKSFQVVLPIGMGKVRGKTLGEITQEALAEKERGTEDNENIYLRTLTWTAGKYTKDVEVTDACKSICERYGWEY